MYALLGVYDWSKLVTDTDVGQKEAARMFGLGMKTLVEVLPKYDVGRFSSYDLSGKTMKQKNHIVHMYHGVHLYQLYALHSING
jgi:D-glucuronyl C5-epimerase C-terminus